MIVHKNDGYYVVSEKSNKNLGGPYDTREDAVKRLQQVEYFKRKDNISKTAAFTIGLSEFYKSAQQVTDNSPSDGIINGSIGALTSTRLGKNLKVLLYEKLLEEQKRQEAEQQAAMASLTPEQKKQLEIALLSKVAKVEKPQQGDPYAGLEAQASQQGGYMFTVTDAFIKKLNAIRDANRGVTYVPQSDGSPKVMSGETGHLKYKKD